MSKKAAHSLVNVNWPSYSRFHNYYSFSSESMSSFNHPTALNPRFQRTPSSRRTIPRPFRGTSFLKYPQQASTGYRIVFLVRGRGARKKGILYSFHGQSLSSLSRVHLTGTGKERERMRGSIIDLAPACKRAETRWMSRSDE